MIFIPKVVQFDNGRFGVRKSGFYGPTFLCAENADYWWTLKYKNNYELKTAEEAVNLWLKYLKTQEKEKIDYGTIVKGIKLPRKLPKA